MLKIVKADAENRVLLTEDPKTLSIENLSDIEIKKELRSDAVQHPLTMVPLASCLLASMYLIFFADIFGGALGTLVLIICAGVTTIASFIWQYFFHYKKAYAKRVKEIIAIQDRTQRERELAEIEQLKETIQSGFSKINSTEGIKALNDLIHEYKELQHILNHKKETDSLSAAHIHALSNEAYRQGLSVLSDALEIAQVIHSSDEKSLEAEIAKFELEIKSLEEDETQKAQIKIKRATIVSHKERIEKIKEQELRVDKLLYQCDRCEASLHRTRLELAALKTESAETSVSAVTETLTETINQAKDVQNELKKLGY
jgi:hypothetical protein